MGELTIARSLQGAKSQRERRPARSLQKQAEQSQNRRTDHGLQCKPEVCWTGRSNPAPYFREPNRDDGQACCENEKQAWQDPTSPEANFCLSEPNRLHHTRPLQ